MRHDPLDLAEQHQQSKQQAIRYIQSQLALTVAIAVLMLFFDVVKAYSALTGGLIATIANAWFAYKVFRVGADSAAEVMLASVYVGELYKIILIGAMFLCAFVLIKPVSAVVLLISFFVIYMTPALVSVLSDTAGHNAGNVAADTAIKREKDG